MQPRDFERVTPKTVPQPFHGRILPGLCFDNGHSLWIYDFESTPTGLGGYRELWIVEPDDRRILHYDIEGAEVEIARFHDWDVAVHSEMNWDWTADRIDIHVSGGDGTTVDLTATVGESMTSRLLTVAQRTLPGMLHERVFGAHTETGAWGHLETPTVRVVTEARASIDGTNLGPVCSPPREIAFGEVRARRQPFVYVGDLLLEYPMA